MEHNTNRILWTVLALAIGIALCVGFKRPANGLLQQGVEKIQTVATNIHGNTNDSSSINSNSSSSSSTNTAVGANLLKGTAKFDFPLYSNGGTPQTVQKYDDETNYIQYTSNTPISWMGPWWSLTPEVGQVYTLSADVSGNGYIQKLGFRYEGDEDNNFKQVNLTNHWQRISNTFRVNRIGGNWVIYAYDSTLLKIKYITIEKGSVATPWVP